MIWAVVVRALAAAALAVAGCSSAPAATAPAASAAVPTVVADAVNLRGKTVRLIVGYTPGGGFDANARVLAPYLAQALPGNPTVVVENMPGADSLVAARTVLSGQPRGDDISVVIYIASLLTKSALLGGLDGFTIEGESAFLGKPDGATSPLALCARKEVVPDLAAFLSRTQPLKVAGLTGTSNYDAMLRWTKEVGYPIDIVPGYAGTAQMGLAFNQGEVDAVPSCRDIDLVQNSDWLAKDQITPLFYWAIAADALKKAQGEGRYPWFKNVLDVRQVSADQRAVLENWNNSSVGSNVYAMHKLTPAPVLNTMRSAFMQAVNNPAFLADMDKRQLQAGYQSPQDIEKSIAGVINLSPSGRELLKRMLGA
ncbi:MAG TPA: hypothetical protein VGQ62_11085 [Chloroflexota bacterium]|nr:hypothetical protein [Chloroflexota bacterium]